MLLKIEGKIVDKIIVTQHAADRWSEKIDPGEKYEPAGIAFLLWFYLEKELIHWIAPKSYGIFCADSEIVFCGKFDGDSLIIQTFIGRRSAIPALHWDPAAAILWHRQQRRLEKVTYARAM